MICERFANGPAYNAEVELLFEREQRVRPLEEAIVELSERIDGSKPFFYALESLTFGKSDTIYLPVWWNLVEHLKRRFDTEAIIVHTGSKWQAANGVEPGISNKASNVRKAIYAAYQAIAGSNTDNVSSDSFVDKNHYDAVKALSEMSGRSGRRLQSDIRRISEGNLAEYTLHELAANMAAITYARGKGLEPVKLSLKNQAADYIALYRFKDEEMGRLLKYVIRFPLFTQPFGETVPYSVPSKSHPPSDDYLLLSDTPESLKAKAERGGLDGMLQNAGLLFHFLGDEKNGAADLFEATSKMGKKLLAAASSAGGYPFSDFVPAVDVGRLMR